MKYLLHLFVVLSFPLYGQSLHRKLSKIRSEGDAFVFVHANPDMGAEIIHLSSDTGNSKISQTLLQSRKRKTLTIGNYTYKIIEKKTSTAFRVSYIYLRGDQLTKYQIDSLRSVIISRYNAGNSFTDLVREYNMDGNKTGDLGWFTPGEMVKDFQKAVDIHEKGDVFTVDIPENDWYYVVLKTHQDLVITLLTALKIKTQK